MAQGQVSVQLAQQVVAAVSAAFDREITVDQALIRPATAGHGADFQSNAAMSLAKPIGRPAREVADEIAGRLDAADLVARVEVAGPGFINITLSDRWLERHVGAVMADERLGVPVAERPESYVVDYSGPNVAKEMHVGHLRSTIIGDAIVRMLGFAGHGVTRRNHLGDWGTPFGMLLEHMVDEGWSGPDAADPRDSRHTVTDLNAFYRDARKKFDADPAFAERARRRVVTLQGGQSGTGGTADTLDLWRGLVAESERHFQKVYELLGVLLTPQDSFGESYYNPFLADTVGELEERGLARVSDGALCVFPAGFTGRDGTPLPIIVRKSDGGYTYGTTDLAGVRYWVRERGATELVYVVGSPQRQHFEMVFAAATEAGWLGESARATYVPFGSILGEDGRMFRTRAGDSVRLVDLLEEAIARAAEVVEGRTEFSGDAKRGVARAVGIGAVKYADLSSDRERDYVFSWDKMLAMDGNTSVYLQYANARIQSVLRKAAGTGDPGDTVDVADLEDLATAELRITHPAERALMLELTRFGAALEAATAALQPHRLCTYLYELASTFSAFYEQCPILSADDPAVGRSRLALSASTSRTIALGLSLLGIDAPARL